MKSDLKGYTPINVEYVIEEEAKEVFPLSLDFSSLEEEKLNGEKPITNKRDALKFIGKVFTATFPDNELVTRKLDDFEKQNIREEYCTLEENDVPKRKLELEIAIERAKKMKKDAEEAYASVLMEVAKYAAEVKLGTIDVRLKAKDTFCIALAGYYLVYSWGNTKECFVLAKAYEIPDRTELWANEEKNRKAMKELFGLDFAEMELISDTSQEENIDDTEDDDLPFGE
ncbi:hypothetical protein [Leyella stercorea]|uniref:hypothetical protein n=1 Tax=Leyella stercorea TaxID=363265 RepID=UPI003AF082F8